MLKTNYFGASLRKFLNPHGESTALSGAKERTSAGKICRHPLKSQGGAVIPELNVRVVQRQEDPVVVFPARFCNCLRAPK